MSVFTNTLSSEIKGRIGKSYVPRKLVNNNRHLKFVSDSPFFYNTLIQHGATIYLIAISVLKEDYFPIKSDYNYGNFETKFFPVAQTNSVFKIASSGNESYNF